jgi:hypothetical protein
MTIDEAIKVLLRLGLRIRTEQDYRRHKAARLGIEALERIKILRDSVPAVKLNLADHLLPSETEEKDEKSKNYKITT